MTISEKFKSTEMFKRLLRRGPNFAMMIDHVCHCGGRIVETGTAWDKNNWEGQGQSTLIWDWLINENGGLRAISIDIRQEGIDIAEKQTKNIEYVCGDSVKVLADLCLNGFAEDISLLYLDSLDWTPEMNLESAFHHVLELTSVWAKLRPGTMIVVDDRHGHMKGKHWMVELFMDKIGLKPVFKNCQIGWIKA